jgi:hypothetical protein
MTALLRLLFVVPFAYVLAILAAGFTIAFAAVGNPDDAPDLFVIAFIVNTIYVGLVAFLPAAVAILAAEAARLRSPFYYLAVGATLGFAADQLHFYVGRTALYSNRPFLYVAGGMIGAGVYWLIAGMNAGAGFTAAEEDAADEDG